MLLPILYCVTAVVSVAAALFCLSRYFKRRSRQDMVYDNSAFFPVSLFLFIFSGIIIRLALLGNWHLSLLPALICLLCLAWFVSWHNEVVIFTEEGFTRRDFFGRSRFYRYTDLTEISKRTFSENRHREEVHMLFCMDKKRFFLSCKAVNYDRFIAYIRRYGRKGIAP